MCESPSRWSWICCNPVVVYCKQSAHVKTMLPSASRYPYWLSPVIDVWEQELPLELLLCDILSPLPLFSFPFTPCVPVCCGCWLARLSLDVDWGAATACWRRLSEWFRSLRRFNVCVGSWVWCWLCPTCPCCLRACEFRDSLSTLDCGCGLDSASNRTCDRAGRACACECVWIDACWRWPDSRSIRDGRCRTCLVSLSLSLGVPRFPSMLLFCGLLESILLLAYDRWRFFTIDIILLRAKLCRWRALKEYNCTLFTSGTFKRYPNTVARVVK